MKLLVKFFIIVLTLTVLASFSYAISEVQEGFRCITIQTFVWPVKTPENDEIQHSTQVIVEGYKTDETGVGQMAWKTCRRTLGQQFHDDWKRLGFKQAPFPLDEFGSPRPPEICIDIYTNPSLYSCHKISREADSEAETLIVVENSIVK